MGSSAALVLRRLFSGILSSNYSPCRGFVANRTIITNSNRRISGSASSSNGLLPNQRITNRCVSTAAPWLMLRSLYTDSEADWTYRFHSFAESQTYTFLINRRGDCFRPNMLSGNVVGSSRGWIALHDVWTEHYTGIEMNEFYLSDPTTFREIDLPPVKSTARLRSLILDRRENGNAFVIITKSGLASCSLNRSREWAQFAAGAWYESIIYSIHHRCLFALTSASDLECWDVEPAEPVLDRSVRLDLGGERMGLTKAVYLVSAEGSGELFVVIRFVRTGNDDYVAPTVDFEVYEVDLERGTAVKMEESLGGMAMFVGLNEGVFVKDVWGLRPDSIYFAYDKRGCYERYDGDDVGIFDYGDRKIYPIDLSHPLNRALWFGPAI
ncbi:hypothetical protein OROGR_027332 [Orobanche gracilis]